MRRARLLPVLLACLIAGCGSGEPAADVTVVPDPTTSAQATTPAPATTAATGPTGTPSPPALDDDGSSTLPPDEAPNPGGASADEAAEGGAGDEEPIRQPARFELGSVSLQPASVTVAPFLAVELTVANVDEGFHRVKLVGTDVAFTVQGGRTERRMLPGLKAGTYTLSVDGGEQAAVLVVGGEAGP